MYHIALCDDIQKELYKTELLLEAYKEAHPEFKFSVIHFTTVESLISSIKDGQSFDILLLDIYLPGKTGIEGANELRQNGFDGHIIFLTSSTIHGVDAFNVDATQYLVKPIDPERFFAVFEKVIKKISDAKIRYVALRTDGVIRKVSVGDIVYSESQNQYQSIHLSNGEEIRVRMTLTEFHDLVSQFSDFTRVGRTYIVNLGFVDSLNSKTMSLALGKVIWLPRGSYSALKEEYFKFYGKL